MICGPSERRSSSARSSRAPAGLVSLEDFFGRHRVVDDGVVGRAFAEVSLDGAHVIGGGVAVGLAGLRDDVADVDHPRVGAADRARDAADEQVGDDAGVQAARPDDDGVRLGDLLDRLLGGGGVFGLEIDVLDGRLVLSRGRCIPRGRSCRP